MSDNHENTGLTGPSDRETRKRKTPPAPGAVSSPQMPGMVPDRSTVPGHFSTRVPRAAATRRPLTQYGTAEEIMGVYRRVPEAELTPKHFEQATATYEELRKAHLAELPAVRPADPALTKGKEAAALPADTSASQERG